MRLSCQSGKRGSFSMAVQSSEGERCQPGSKPLIAREMSTRISTRPMSKIMARILPRAKGLLTPGFARDRASRPENTDNDRDHRKNHNDRNHVMNACTDIGHGAAQEKASKDHRPDP